MANIAEQYPNLCNLLGSYCDKEKIISNSVVIGVRYGQMQGKAKMIRSLSNDELDNYNSELKQFREAMNVIENTLLIEGDISPERVCELLIDGISSCDRHNMNEALLILGYDFGIEI